MSQKTTHIDSEYARKRRRWVAIDANEAILGRLATKAAALLRGKHKPYFSPSVDCGDFVIVTNTDGIRLSGNKEESKAYFRHSGYAKGAKLVPYKLQMERDSTKVVHLAVKRMLPATRLRQHQMRRLKVYTGSTHPFAAQKAEVQSVK